jgi:hypothetical protein
MFMFSEVLRLATCDPWQRALLRSDAQRVLLNIARQLGKFTTTAVLALHRALYRPGARPAPSTRCSGGLRSERLGEPLAGGVVLEDVVV